MLIKRVFMKIYGLIASAIIVVMLLILSIPFLKPKYEGSSVTFSTPKGNQTFNVEIADTAIKRTVGLMNRTSLPEKSGMLFVFDQEGVVGFWMKNTLIPLDMVFISEESRDGQGPSRAIYKKIVNIKRNAQPCKVLDCESYSSGEPVKYVIEINGGLADKLGIKEGQRVDI